MFESIENNLSERGYALLLLILQGRKTAPNEKLLRGGYRIPMRVQQVLARNWFKEYVLEWNEHLVHTFWKEGQFSNVILMFQRTKHFHKTTSEYIIMSISKEKNYYFSEINVQRSICYSYFSGEVDVLLNDLS